MSTGWAAFYTRLYMKIDLADMGWHDLGHGLEHAGRHDPVCQPVMDDYLPQVLGELEHGRLAGSEPVSKPHVRTWVFERVRDDAIEENQRAYERAKDAVKFADHFGRQFNPWEETS